MKKNIGAKIFAFLALFWIVIWIIGTGLLFLFPSNHQYGEEIELSTEQIQELIDAQEQTASWIVEDNSLSEIISETETEVNNLEESIIEEVNQDQ